MSSKFLTDGEKDYSFADAKNLA